MTDQTVPRKSRTWIWVLALSVSILISITSFLYGLAQQIRAENNLMLAAEQQREALAWKRQLELQREECETRVAEAIAEQAELALKGSKK
jgi:hypothetical protein